MGEIIIVEDFFKITCTLCTYYLSHIFHPNRVGNGNDDISSEEHIGHSKTSRGS
jgi:hypothetical protein